MKKNEYIKLEDAIKIIREQGVYGTGYSREEIEDDVISMLESLERFYIYETE